VLKLTFRYLSPFDKTRNEISFKTLRYDLENANVQHKDQYHGRFGKFGNIKNY
jgi:hypothetical protein